MTLEAMKDVVTVLLPGLDGTGVLFERLIQALPGEMPVTVARYSPDAIRMDDLLQELRDQLPRGRRLVLVAESFSGPLVIKCLQSQVEIDIAGIVFCSSFARVPRPFLLSLLKLFPASQLVRLGTTTLAIRLFCLDWSASHMLVEKCMQVIRSIPAETFAGRLLYLSQLDVRGGLEKLVGLPTCYIQAERDRLVPKHAVEDFHRALPDIRVHRIDGPHLILQTRPGECAGVIAEFAERCS